MGVKFSVLTEILSIKFKWDVILAIFDKFIIKHIVSKRNVLLAIHNFSELKSLAKNAKIRFWLKFLIIQYQFETLT